MAGLRVRSMDGGCQGGAVLAQGLARNFAIAFGGLWSGLCGCARPPGPRLMQVRGLVRIFATAFGGPVRAVRERCLWRWRMSRRGRGLVRIFAIAFGGLRSGLCMMRC